MDEFVHAVLRDRRREAAAWQRQQPDRPLLRALRRERVATRRAVRRPR